MPDRSIHLVGGQHPSAALVGALSSCGRTIHTHVSLDDLKRQMRADRRGDVWLVPFDAAGEALMRWARTHAPAAKIVALIGRLRGNDVHRAYELGASYCASHHPGDAQQAVAFALGRPHEVGSRTRLRRFDSARQAEDAVKVLPAPRSA